MPPSSGWTSRRPPGRLGTSRTTEPKRVFGAEARVAALVVDRLTRLGIDPGDVGVVTLFRAHADAVA